MVINLYNTNSDNRVLNKVLTSVITLENVVLSENCSIINPTFIFSGENIPNANYLYCEKFGRYYYINDIEYQIGKLIYIRCSVDVLMSFQSDVLNCNAIVERAQNNINVLLQDNFMLTQTNINSVNKKLSESELLNGINADNISYVLTCYE